MSVNDVILENMNALNRVVVSTHNKVCRVKIDAESFVIYGIKELSEHSSGLRAGLGSKP